MRVTSGSITRQVMSDISTNAERLQRIQAQMSSGKLIDKPSDNPAGVAESLSLRSEKSGLTQYSDNIDKALDWLNSTTEKLTSVEDTLLEVISLATQGESDLTGQDALDALADQVDEYLNEIVDLANSRSGGKAIFGGTQTLSDPFTVARDADGNITGVTQAYPDSIDNDVIREISKGSTITVNSKGGSLFQSGGAGGEGDMFQALIDLSAALRSGDVEDIGAQGDRIQTIYDRVVNEDSIVGAKITRLESVQSRLTNEITNITDRISGIEDADYAQAAIDYQVAENIYSASLDVGAQIIQMSLVDYI